MTDPFDGPECEVPGCRRPQAPGWLLCASDGRWLGDALARLGDRYAGLSAAPSLAARTPDGGGHGGTLASQRDPARLHVLVLTDRRSRERDDAERDPRGETGEDANDLRSVFEVLHAHAEAVREERQLSYPTLTAAGLHAGDRPHGPACADCAHPSCRWIRPGPDVDIPAPLTVATERAVLAAHLDWILAQDWAADFHSDITALWTLLGGRTVGACPDCGAGLRLLDKGTRCTGCGRQWTGLQMVELNTGRTA